MNSELFFFTGTGNTLYLAKELRARLGGAKLTSIAGLLGEGRISTEAEVVGILFPIYFLNLPRIVRAFVARLDSLRAEYAFALDTCGQRDGGALSIVRGLAARGGLRLDAGFRVILPDNSIVFPTRPELHAPMFAAAAGNLDRIAARIAAREPGFDPNPGTAGSLVGYAMKGFCEGVLGFKDLRFDAARCTGCGVCAEACPVSNIAMEGSTPRRESAEKCESCFACVHRCPAKAIRFRRQSAQEDYQYRNPRVPFAELKYRGSGRAEA